MLTGITNIAAGSYSSNMMNRLTGLIIIILVTAFAACKNNNDAPTPTLSTSLDVVNASADTVNFYLNGTRLNVNSNLYPSSSSGYFTVLAGQQNYQVKDRFNPAENTVRSLFSIPLALDTGHYYSLFIGGARDSDAFYSNDILLLDTVTNTCLVRFVNASPDAGSLSMALGDTTQFVGQPFKSVSDFTLIGISGVKAVKVYQAGSSTPIYQNTVELLQGKSYTFFSKGSIGGKGTKAFSVGVAVNVN